MVDALNKYFSSVFTKESYKPHPSVEYLPDINESGVLRDIHISEDIVSKKLDLLRDDKSGGPDDPSPRFLKRIKDVPLTMIFRHSLDEGVVPMDWRTANVSPIFKKGDKTVPGNYRPVSLTSQTCKIFESIIRDDLVFHLETQGLIRDSQHGFRRGNSCLSNLLVFG